MSISIPTVQHCSLHNGHRLSYTIYGPSTGFPIFYFSGWPSSRFDWLLFDPEQQLAQRLQIRLIAINRPGYGDSDAQKGNTLLKSADYLSQLADALELPQFALLGYSGGGPFALASASQLSSRIQGMALVASLSPFQVPGATQAMQQATKIQYWLTRYFPGLYRTMWTQLAKQPNRFIQGAISSLRPADVKVLSEPTIQHIFTMMIAGMERHDIQAASQEGALISRPWKAPLEKISSPVHIWQGIEDVNAPPSMGQYLAQILPKATFHLLPQEGHISIAVHHAETILTELLKTTRNAA
jgi:pimeloyl-ACP methyl ester carboxylesterase